MPAFLAADAENRLGTLWPLEAPSGRFFTHDVYRTVVDARIRAIGRA